MPAQEMARPVHTAHSREESEHRKLTMIQSGQDDQQIEYRRKFFDYFLKQLASIKYLFTSAITQ